MEFGSQAVMDQDCFDKFVNPYSSTPNLFQDDRLAHSLIIGDVPRESSRKSSRQIQEAMNLMESLMLQPIPLLGPSIFLKEKSLAEQGFVKL